VFWQSSLEQSHSAAAISSSTTEVLVQKRIANQLQKSTAALHCNTPGKPAHITKHRAESILLVYVDI
jgi:hypothetical protein